MKYLVVLTCLAIPSLGFAQMLRVPNASFEKGVDSPVHWELVQGKGYWAKGGTHGERCLAVRGNGNDRSAWACADFRFEPDTCYRVAFDLRRGDGAAGGSATTGTSGVNRDMNPQALWKRYSFVFRSPVDTKDFRLQFGQWHVDGDLFYDNVAVWKVTRVDQTFADDLVLGKGEKIQDGTYSFVAPFRGEGTNDARPFVSSTAYFNTNRWAFSSGNCVIYRHRVGTFQQNSAELSVTVNYYVSGKLVVDASRDGRQWVRVGEIAKREGKEFVLPSRLFPASEIWVRFTASPGGKAQKDGGNFQINQYRYKAVLEKGAPNCTGKSVYVTIDKRKQGLAVEFRSLGSLRPNGKREVALFVRAARDVGPARLILSVTPSEGGGANVFESEPFRLTKRGQVVRAKYDVRKAGHYKMTITIQREKDKTTLYRSSLGFSVSPLDAADYGYLLAQKKGVALWWAESTYKISQDRPVPLTKSQEISISAAKNEYEPFQLVIRSDERNLRGVQVRVSDLKNESGAVISSRNVSIWHVGYVPVRIPTDGLGQAGLWPDPLPPVEGPFSVQRGINHPLWITVHVGTDVSAGDYVGKVVLSAENWETEVPVRVHVWDFALPKRPTLQSGFGLSLGNIWRYQNLKTQEEREKVFDLYMKNFAEHRLAPYNPDALHPIKVSFGKSVWGGGRIDTKEAFQGKQSLLVVDASTGVTVTATHEKPFPIDPRKRYVLSFAAKTKQPGAEFMVSLTTYDANGNWISGHNLDYVFKGTGKWRNYSVEIADRFAKNARSAIVNLRATKWTPNGEATGTTWFDSVKFCEIPNGKNLVPDPGFEESIPSTEVSFDFTGFDKAMERYLDDFGFRALRLRVLGMGGGTFYSRRKGSLGGFPEGTPEYEALFKKYLRGLTDHLRKHGWLDECYVYWFDEPAPKDYAFVRSGMMRLKKAAPDLTRMLTEQPEPALYGAVDLWCPVLHAFDFKRAEERRKHGERFWWYVCTGPKAPYCGLFIDHPAIDMRMWLWQTWQNKVEGILVWQTNYWTSPAAFPDKLQNPWEDAMSYVSGYGYKAGTIGYWGNGDGRFFYPPNRHPNTDRTKYVTGPVNSFRWEMLREGMEDVEYFYALKNLAERARKGGVPAWKIEQAEKLLTVPPAICKDLTTFTKDPQLLFAHRKKLAEAIEMLERALH